MLTNVAWENSEFETVSKILFLKSHETKIKDKNELETPAWRNGLTQVNPTGLLMHLYHIYIARYDIW